MATDALTALQASVTKTATFSGASLNLPGGTPRRGLKARIIYSAAANASGANSVEFSIDVSADGVTWLAAEAQGAENVLALSTTAQSGEFYIPFETSETFVRLTCTIAGAGASPTITYFSDITFGRP